MGSRIPRQEAALPSEGLSTGSSSVLFILSPFPGSRLAACHLACPLHGTPSGQWVLS